MKRTILIVDDSEFVRNYHSYILQQAEFGDPYLYLELAEEIRRRIYITWPCSALARTRLPSWMSSCERLPARRRINGLQQWCVR